MARRATLLAELREQSAHPVIHLVGADEFVADRPASAKALERPVSPHMVKALYKHLGVDAGYLSAASSAWFGAEGLPDNLYRIETTPQTSLLVRGGLRVALVFLPTLAAMGQDAGAALVPVLQRSLQEARSAADVLVAVSPWGFEAEEALSPQLARYADVLVGGGSGAPFAEERVRVSGQPDAPDMLWIRPDVDGRCSSIVHVARPSKSTAAKGQQAAFRFSAQEICPDTRFDPDPAVETLLSR